MTLPTFVMFGLTGTFKMWRFGGGISINFSKDVNEIEALSVLENKIAEYKSIIKEISEKSRQELGIME